MSREGVWTVPSESLLAGSESTVQYVGQMNIAMNQDDFFTEQSSYLRLYRIPQMHLSIEISVFGDCSLFFRPCSH